MSDQFSYHLPFKEGGTILELGGGERPLMKQIQGLKSVNVDVRKVPGVDIVRNLEDGFSDLGQFDGCFSNYLLEHISWRRVPWFLEQCYKVLKPDSCAVFVCPDTYAQLQKILQRKPEEIDWGDSNFIFGGQDFPDNLHKWCISRPFLEKLLKDAGFDSIRFINHPDPNARDMFVEAYKGATPVVMEKFKVKGQWNEIHPEAEIGDGSDIWSWNYVGKAKIGKRCHITNWVHIGDGCVIGDDCNFQPHSYLTSNAKVGNRVFIAGGVQFTDIKYLKVESNPVREPVTIGDDVVLANGVRLLGGIKIGDRAVIAMGAVVTKDVPAGEVWMGLPAKYHCTREEYDRRKKEYEDERRGKA